MNDTLPPVDTLTYEQAFAELEALVVALESEEHSLDHALERFERGQALSRHCLDLLDKAELKIQQLVGDEFESFDA